MQRCRLALEAASGARSTIGDIAFRCGFANQTHFTRLFAQRFGMRPREARMAAARREPPSDMQPVAGASRKVQKNAILIASDSQGTCP